MALNVLRVTNFLFNIFQNSKVKKETAGWGWRRFSEGRDKAREAGSPWAEIENA